METSHIIAILTSTLINTAYITYYVWRFKRLEKKVWLLTVGNNLQQQDLDRLQGRIDSINHRLDHGA